MNREVLDFGRVIAVVDLSRSSRALGEYNGRRTAARAPVVTSSSGRAAGVGLEGFVLVAGDSERSGRADAPARGARCGSRGQTPVAVGGFVPAPPLPDEDEVA